MQYNKYKIKQNKGAALMILVLFFVFISVTILIGVITPTIREFKIATDSFQSKQTYFLAESGVEDVLYRLKNNKKISTSENLVLGASTAATTITDISGGQKEITSLGNMNGVQRKVSIMASLGTGISFQYGVQAGAGGFSMGDHSKVYGSIYAGGPVKGRDGHHNQSIVTGSVTSSNSAALAADQQNGDGGTPAYNLTFAKENSNKDIAQSFTSAVTGPVSKVELYLKKIGSPSNRSVYLVNDNNGIPDNSVLNKGTLSASLVSTSYGWVSVSFTSYPQLVSGNKYWIVIDGSDDSRSYYIIGANTAYANGEAKYGNDHDHEGHHSGNWIATTPSNADVFFKVYLGGVTGIIENIIVGSAGVGNAAAHTVNGSTVAGTIYCSVTTDANNKACIVPPSDPVGIDMPISEQNIQDWKDAAALGDTIAGYTPGGHGVSLGPKKINGTLHLDDGDTLTITGTLWITGNLIIDRSAKIKLSTAYGSASGVIIVDGRIVVSSDADFTGSGTIGSYILALSTSDCPSNPICDEGHGLQNAIDIGKNVDAVMLYANNGTIYIKDHSEVKQITAYGINIANNVELKYNTGIADVNFINGPGGTWNVNSWKEVE